MYKYIFNVIRKWKNYKDVWLTNHKINSINKTIIVLAKELSSLQDIDKWITNLSLNFENEIVTSAKQVFIDLRDNAEINKNYLKELKQLVSYIDDKLAKNNNLSKEKVLTKILRKKNHFKFKIEKIKAKLDDFHKQVEDLEEKNIDRKKSLLRDEVKKLEDLKIVLRNEFNKLNFQQKILESEKVILAENVENKIKNEIKNNDGLISLNIFLRLINNKKSKIAFFNNKIADLNIKITNLETKEDGLNKQITKINWKIVELDTSQTNVNTRITNLETKEDGLNKQITKINKEVKDVQTWQQSKNAPNKQWFDNAAVNNCSWVAVTTDDTKPLLNYC